MTTPNSTVEAVEVTQADRDVAADAVKAYRDQKNGNWQQRIRDGLCDDGEMVQAFARHRIAAMPAPSSGGKGDAALREAARKAHDTLIELNPNNYGHDDVCEANNAAIEAILLLADALGETHGKSAEWWAKRRAAIAAMPAVSEREAVEVQRAKFFFEVGYGSAWADAFIENGEKPAFTMSDETVERAWAIAPEAYPDPEIWARNLATTTPTDHEKIIGKLVEALEAAARHCPKCEGTGSYGFKGRDVDCEYCEIPRAALCARQIGGA